MYRQNTVLNDFVNFLKARGRFREIEFIDNSVHATPRIPDFPSLIFYIEETQSEQLYTLEIHGNESTVMNREILEFFHLNQLELSIIRIKDYLETINGELLTIEIEGIGSPFETLEDQISKLIETSQYSIKATQKTLVFSLNTNKKNLKHHRSPQVLTKTQTRNQAASIEATIKHQPIKTNQIDIEAPHDLEKTPKKKPLAKKTISQVKETAFDQVRTVSPPSDDLRSTSTSPTPNINNTNSTPKEQTFTSSNDKEPILKDELGQDFVTDSENTHLDLKMTTDDLERDLFHPKVPDKSYSDDIAPFLKQTTTLFRRDNWEEDLPSEFEMEILERTYMRIKHRTKPEILAKDLGVPIEVAESHLRSLISKGLLRTQVGWYIIKKSHLPFFKRTFTDVDKRKKKKKSPRISRVGEGLTLEEIATIKAIKARPNLKAQSNLLTRPTGLKQSVLKEVLRNLVDKGILRVSYGWYILKDKHILEQKRGPSSIDQSMKIPQYKIPKELNLSSAEEKVIQALLQRPQYKAQSNLLTPEVKFPKEHVKQILRDLVEKEICQVKYGWYQLQNPERFQTT
ncbi:MAG: hypothetical protein ACFE8U_06605 [Candidatus Hermodarchaeota archaeon]